MTTLELSNEFDILYNNITSNSAPGLSEYEKSVFLTQAQETTVTEIYTGAFKGEGFEETEEVKKYLDILITSLKEPLIIDKSDLKINMYSKAIVNIPNLLFPIHETCKVSNPQKTFNNFEVVPIDYNSLSKVLNNPFRGVNNHRILRKISGESEYTLLISNKFIKDTSPTGFPSFMYTLTYLRKVKPIILEELTDGLSINEETGVRTSELDSILHRYILVKAVTLAKAVWQN